MLLPGVALLGLMTDGTFFASADLLVYRDRLGEPPATAALVREFQQLPQVRPPSWKELEAQWSFALGSPQEGLNTTLSRLPAKRAPQALPHRILEPDTPYWYVADAAITAPSVLDIRADDGAQLYVNGKRVPAKDDCFVVPPSPAVSHLVVRVLNKAVYGGLESVQIAFRADYDRYQKERSLRARLTALVRKVRLLLSPTPEQLEAVQRAVHEHSPASVSRAEKQLSGLPLTLIGPYLQNAQTESVSIVWETDTACPAAVEWGEGYALTQRASAQSEGALHVVALKSLRPGATYSYRVHSGPVRSAQYTFRTLPAEGPVEFAVWADSHANGSPHGNVDVFRQNVNAMRRLPLTFAVGIGDSVEDGNRQESWVGLFDVLTPLASEVPTMLVGGNHEYDGCFEDLHSVFFERYARNRPRPSYFAWTAGNARFVGLDPNGYFPTGIPSGSEEYRWLLQELESPAWKRALWRFVFIHQPLYSQGWPDYHGDLPIRALLEPLIEKYGIDFIVSGHTHDYERLTRTYGRQTAHLLIVGGGGGGLEGEERAAYPVMESVIRRHHIGHFRIDGRTVTFEAIATDTRVLDRIEVTK